MNKSQLKQIIREVIEESLQTDGPLPDSIRRNMIRRLDAAKAVILKAQRASNGRNNS